MSSMKMFFNNDTAQLVVGALLAGLYPGVFFMVNNWFIFTTPQILFFVLSTPVFLVFISLAVLGTGTLVHKVVFNNKESFGSIGIARVLSSVAYVGVCAWVLLLFHRTTVDAFGSLGAAVACELVFLVVVFFVCVFVNMKYVNLFFATLLVMSSVSWVRSLSVAPMEALSSEEQLLQREKLGSVVFNQKPNIYLILLESYHNREALANIYRYDNGPMESWLSSRGFAIYEEFYSNYDYTLSSAESMFAMEHHYERSARGNDDSLSARDVIGGRRFNPVLQVLKNNDYKVQYLLGNDHLFYGSDYIDYSTVDTSGLWGRAFRLYRKTFLDEFFIKNKLRFRTNYKEQIPTRIDVAAEAGRPYFTFIKLGARHTPPRWSSLPASHPARNEARTDWVTEAWKYLDYWEGEYPRYLEEANSELKPVLSQILEIDPGACVILVGDHGAHRYRNIFLGDDNPNVALRSRKVPAIKVGLDYFGVLFAVRVPDGVRFSEVPKSAVNLFRALFVALSGNKWLEENAAKDESYLIYMDEAFVVTREGEYLQEWEELTIH